MAEMDESWCGTCKRYTPSVGCAVCSGDREELNVALAELAQARERIAELEQNLLGARTQRDDWRRIAEHPDTEREVLRERLQLAHASAEQAEATLAKVREALLSGDPRAATNRIRALLGDGKERG